MPTPPTARLPGLLTRHTGRALLLAAAAAVPAATLVPATLAQQQAPASNVGIVLADVVEAQAKPGESSYAVLRLTRGQRVTVVGMKYGKWLQIVPPEGSYALVPAGHVNRSGAAGYPTTGIANRDLNVRVASRVSDLKWELVDRRVPEGSPLEILGETEDQSYYMIPPPEGMYYYVSKDAVLPEQQAPAELRGLDATPPPPDIPTPQPAVEPVDGGMAAEGMPETADLPDVTGVTPDRPAEPDSPVVENGRTPLDTPDAAPPYEDDTTVTADEPEAFTESTPEAGEAFLDLERRYGELTQTSLEEQQPETLDALAAEYQALLDAGDLGTADVKMADLRLKGLAGRRDAVRQYREVRDRRAEQAAEIARVEQENARITQEVEAAQVTRYKAVGTLRRSKLRLGDEQLYRLTDPATGYTLLYVRPASTVDLPGLVGKFVGLRGEMTESTRVGSLQYLQPETAEEVDITRVGNNVTAELIPATLRGA